MGRELRIKTRECHHTNRVTLKLTPAPTSTPPLIMSTCTRCGNQTIPSEFHIHVIHACPLDLKAQTLNRGSLFLCRPRCYGFNVTASGSERIDNVIKCVVVTLYLKALDIRLFSPLTLLTSEPSRTTQYIRISLEILTFNPFQISFWYEAHILQ